MCFDRGQKLRFIHSTQVNASDDELSHLVFTLSNFTVLLQLHSQLSYRERSVSLLHIMILLLQQCKKAFHKLIMISNTMQAMDQVTFQVHMKTHGFLCKKVYACEKQSRLLNKLLLELKLMRLHASV